MSSPSSQSPPLWEQACQNENEKLHEVRIITGSSHRELAEAVSANLGVKLMDCTVTKFGNTETRIKPSSEEDQTFRGKKIFVVATGSFSKTLSVNDHFMETVFLMDACRRGGSTSITLLLCSYPYARQDKKDSSRAPISSAVVAKILSTYVDRVVCFDLHNPAIQGFFPMSCDNLFPTALLKDWLMRNVFNTKERLDADKKFKDDFVLISPDEGAMKKTRIIANILDLPFLTMSKTRDYKRENHVENMVLLYDPEQLKSVNGDASKLLIGKTAIIVDDMIDTAGTVIQAVEKLMTYGATECGVTATHGVLSGPALDRINACAALKFVLVSDSLPQSENCKLCNKIQVYSVAGMLAEVIRRVSTNHSLATLF